jgi:protease-4
VVASKEIYEAVEDLEKPKVAYFREVAASGGYHIATPTDWIVSEPGALTGNVGARMELIQVVGLMDMLGINTTTFKSGENKDMGSAFRDLTDEEKIILESIVNESFEDFKMSVIRDRGTKLRNTDEIFDGRIMSGRQAYEYGLVDEIGNRQKAIAKAGELSGLGEDPKICKISLTSSMGEGGLFMEFVRRFAEGIGYGFSRGLQENKVKSVKLSYE